MRISQRPSMPSSNIAVETADVQMADTIDVAMPTPGETCMTSYSFGYCLADTTKASDETVDAVEILGREIKRIVQGVQDLRHIGIEQFTTPLPKICVVGDQSTGKSSLIEGISEIRAPRSGGTCTRCPLEINLSDSSEPWKCVLHLRKNYDYVQQKGRNVTAGTGHPFGPWRESEDPKSTQFMEVKSKDEVEDALKWAQLAILNPQDDPGRYAWHATNSPQSSSPIKVSFSPNLVGLDVSGPGIPNLSLYDLPGVIAHDEETWVPKVIQNLARRYIEPKNCIVLLTLTMNHDLANSLAYGMITHSHARDRTVGVLTKPDLLTSESVDQWRKVLSNQEYTLGRGYYVVRNNANPAVDHAKAREEELNFFASEPLFANELSQYQNRFGTLKLQTFLSESLADMIRLSLPELQQKINSKAEAVDSELDELPKPPGGNISLQIQNSIEDFSKRINLQLDGGTHDCVFTKWHASAKKFWTVIVGSHPVLSLEPLPDPPKRSSQGQNENVNSFSSPCSFSQNTIELSDDEDTKTETPQSARTTDKIVANGNGISTPILRPTQDDVHMVEARVLARRFSFKDIRNEIDSVNTGLPGSRDQRVTNELYAKSTGHWDKLIDQFFDRTKILIHSMTFDSLNVFKRWEKTQLQQEIAKSVDEFLLEAFEKQHAKVVEILSTELLHLMTLNGKAQQQAEKEALQLLHDKRRRNRLELMVPQLRYRPEERTINAQTLARLQREAEQKIAIEPDPYQQEILELATVRAYYHVASTRLADNIALSFRAGVFDSCKEDLADALSAKLGINEDDANERCKRLLEVDPNVYERRMRLEREKEALAKAKEQVAELLGDAGAAFTLEHRDGVPTGGEGGSKLFSTPSQHQHQQSPLVAAQTSVSASFSGKRGRGKIRRQRDASPPPSSSAVTPTPNSRFRSMGGAGGGSAAGATKSVSKDGANSLEASSTEVRPSPSKKAKYDFGLVDD